ncbi:MAG: Gfo/Idh/MocA family oxidoreductase [Muribaculaceae bacterium]|nr:Gfo/Idh/MocA family oxidoreductase [Muribaculaceae bacterium]
MTTENEGKRGPVTVVAIGAGNRLFKYLHYILANPDKVRLVGVVEINPLRREKVCEMAHLTPDDCYEDYHEFFAGDRKADAVMICTPEHVHFDPCMMAMAKGYDVMLEKPIARTPEECAGLAAAARRYGVRVAVCHVLRHHPYFSKIKELVDNGGLGDIVSVTHRSPVGLDRGTHGFVRGLWNRSDRSNPIILSKCCHDVDFIVWLTGARCRSLASYGALSVFRAENAPAGSSDRCINCSVEKSCPFSAVDLYKVRREWINNFDVPEGETIDAVIDRELREGQYGRCVYRCDNNVADHQVVAMLMDNGVTVNLSMDVFTLRDYRETHIYMTNGEIHGDETKIEVTRFRPRVTECYDFSELNGQPYHAGADLRMVEDFVLSLRDPGRLPITSIDDVVESHRICFMAEDSRLKHS